MDIREEHTHCLAEAQPSSAKEDFRKCVRMSYARLPRRVRSIASRAHAEAYAGVFLLALGMAVLMFGRCPHSSIFSKPRSFRAVLRTSVEKVPPSVVYGNAESDGSSRKGWWVGHFMRTESPRYSSQIETKWVTHQKGTKHEGFSTNKIATSMAMLISGKHRIEFEGSYILLEEPGDYVLWGPGVAHSWTSIEESTMLCIRWPSIKGDQTHASDDGSDETAAGSLFNQSNSTASEMKFGTFRNGRAEQNGTAHAE